MPIAGHGGEWFGQHMVVSGASFLCLGLGDFETKNGKSFVQARTPKPGAASAFLLFPCVCLFLFEGGGGAREESFVFLLLLFFGGMGGARGEGGSLEAQPLVVDQECHHLTWVLAILFTGNGCKGWGANPLYCFFFF